MTVEDDVVAQIAARTSTVPAPGVITTAIDLVSGQNLRVGPVRKATESGRVALTTSQVPQQCVFVHESGGFPTERFIGGGDQLGALPYVVDPDAPQGWERLEKPTVDVYTRSLPRAYDDGLALAYAMLQSIDRSPPTGYLEAKVVTPRPNYVSENEQDCHVWVFSVELIKCLP